MTNSFTSSGLFGSLFSDDAIATKFSAASFTKRMLEFEASWTNALVEVGTVSAADGVAAIAAINAYGFGDLGPSSGRDGLPAPGFVAALKHGLPAGAADAIHKGATSQDVIDTATVLTCRAVAEDLRARMQTVVSQVDELEHRFGARQMMARTRMQGALPATVGLRLGAWKRPLMDHLARLDGVLDDLSFAQIGGAIGLRNTPEGQGDRVAASVAASLGLRLGPVWHADRSAIMAFGHWLALVTGTLGKIGQDVALMAQHGVDEIAMSSGGGSSAMPHKQNPIAAETMVTLARFVAGQQGVLLQAMVHEQERSGAAWALEWMTLPAMAEATGASLNHAVRLLGSVARMGAAD
ncbi:MAG: 3-carboxy-cis,cis-muconate cycloisomerase [Loktanella sp.]|nr:3-carboxy-cis,cis-muconate cycloisomerase [Loktanella sp.]MDO7728453.1 3-carboxy-cis,cis-muconate cycloisomerase [Loktanella sp.]